MAKKILRQGNRFAARVRRRYFSEGEKQNISTVSSSSTPRFEFYLNNVTVNFVRNALRSLKTNKAVGLDKLSAHLLKDASDLIAPIVAGLINKSFADGVFPGVWKSKTVTVLRWR